MVKEFFEITEQIARLGSQIGSCALATVVEVSGSTYRTIGARMLIGPGDKVTGSISGGCLEGDVVLRSRAVVAGGKAALVTYDTTSPEDIFWGTGMGCGGKTTVLIQPLTQHLSQVLTRAAESLRRDHPVVLLTLLERDGTLAHADLGLSALCGEEGEKLPAGFAELGETQELARACSQVLADKKPRILTFGEESVQTRVVLEALVPPQHLVVFGGGHDVLPVLHTAKNNGWRVSIVLRRKELDDGKFSSADSVLVWQDDELPALDFLNDRTACVVMTHQYLEDRDILLRLMPSPVWYIGLLGPQKRARQLLDELEQGGHNFSRQQYERLYSPVGLDLGAETAEEIALSIIGEILALSRNRRGGLLRDRRGAIHDKR